MNPVKNCVTALFVSMFFFPSLVFPQGTQSDYERAVKFVPPIVLSYVASAIPNHPVVTAEGASTAPVENRAPLRPDTLIPLPLTSIKPRGWLRRQLQIQADGLTGHLGDFWEDVGPKSGWLGGTGESWERGPYYSDGLVPLAYLLGDPKLIAKAKQWMEWTLTHQRPDGSIGPETNKDWWPNMVMLKALTQYQEATGDPRVVPLMQRYFHYQAANLAERPLFEWARFRWADEVVSVLWLYNHTGDESLLDLARTLKAQGYDWRGEFENFPYKAKITKDDIRKKPDGNNDASLSAHGVNNAMAIKTSAVWSLVSGDDSDRKAAAHQLSELDQYHLLPNGMFSCDEHLAGRDPSQGTELCSVVEEQFSLEQLISILGDPAYADRLERIAFNALPGTFSKDMWAHQYDQQPNQVMCSLEKRDWTSNGPEANVFGVEPNFGCCTANMHQGWPKFVASMWMATPDHGLVAVTYGPSQVTSQVRSGVRVTIEEETAYPFKGEIQLTVNPITSVDFPLLLRIPAWADGAKITVNGKSAERVRPGQFHRIERTWKKGDKVVVTLPMRVRASTAFNNSVVVERGPLVFSLMIGEKWQKIGKGMSKPSALPGSDWAIVPTTPWNYGLIIDRDKPEAALRVIEKPMGEYPFSPEGTPLMVRGKGRRIPDWKLVHGSAGPLPASPLSSGEPIEALSLIPYGAAKLRITAFPQLSQ
ncbi:MAG TPA: beta-L-arabinofuranosidase domain-containing protein [Terriglobia bacterium]|nr:beta-L-arabinofuranosidase domain-containing protein [Terriglobia bacterium]